MGSIFAFLTLLSMLGPRSLKSERKSLISPQTDCFAMIASPLKYGLRVNRSYSDPSLRRSTSFSAAATPDSNEALVQVRPTPRATVSYTAPKGGGVLCAAKLRILLAQPSF